MSLTIQQKMEIFPKYGIDIRGQYVVNRIRSVVDGKTTHKRPLIGKIETLLEVYAELSDFSDKDTISTVDCYPETRKENFEYLLRSLFGQSYTAEKPIYRQRRIIVPYGRRRQICCVVKRVAKELRDLGIIKVADGITAFIQILS